MSDDTKKDKWANEWKPSQGMSQEAAEKAQAGVNKPASEVLSESWNNIKDVFTGRANAAKQNIKRSNGGYPRR
jgi:hypothetical protein